MTELTFGDYVLTEYEKGVYLNKSEIWGHLNILFYQNGKFKRKAIPYIFVKKLKAIAPTWFVEAAKKITQKYEFKPPKISIDLTDWDSLHKRIKNLLFKIDTLPESVYSLFYKTNLSRIEILIENRHPIPYGWEVQLDNWEDSLNKWLLKP